jgi:GxxExxY protein
MTRSDAETAGSGGGSLLHSELTHRLIGLFFDVYKELGGGFLEHVYREAFAISLRDAGLPFARESSIPVHFRGRVVGSFKPDFIVEDAVIVECKALRALEDAHLAQVLNYLRAARLSVGLLLNFGPQREFRRLVSTDQRSFRVAPRPPRSNT